MMNRYLKGKQDEQTGPRKLRPFLASECSDLQEADKWHHQIIREISRKVYEIQNAGLGEHRFANRLPLPCALKTCSAASRLENCAHRHLPIRQPLRTVRRVVCQPCAPAQIRPAARHCAVTLLAPPANVCSHTRTRLQVTRPQRRDQQIDTREGALGEADRGIGRARLLADASEDHGFGGQGGDGGRVGQRQWLQVRVGRSCMKYEACLQRILVRIALPALAVSGLCARPQPAGGAGERSLQPTLPRPAQASPQVSAMNMYSPAQ
jgi:Isy1-like splicing family